MLQEIVKYAEREGLGMDGASSSNFETKAVAYDISLNMKGQLASDPIFFEGEPKFKIKNGKEKQIKTKREMSVPFTSKNEVAGGKVYHTLYGCFEILLSKSKKSSAKDKLNFFKTRVLELSKMCPKNSARLKAVAKFLDDKNEVKKVLKYITKNKIKLSESVTFTVGGARLIDEKEVRSAWNKLRKSKAAAVEENKNVCLLSGEYTDTVKGVEGMKRVWGGSTYGTSLISFDKPSFNSYDLDGCNNAPISFESELKLRYGLQSLIDHNSVVMGDNTYLYWTKNGGKVKTIMDALKVGDINDVKKLLVSPVSGNEVDSLIDDDVYYLLSLMPNGGRIAVKNYIMCGMKEITENIRSWFQDCSYVGCDRYGIENLFRSLKKPGEKYDDYNHYNNMIEAMIQSALLNLPLPGNILSEAVHRELISKITGDGFNPSRLALMKLCLRRKGNTNMTEKLNETSTDLPYLCGRLLATINRLHKQAMKNVEHSFVEKMFGSACSRPAYAFSSILQKIQNGYYYKQANRNCGGMGTNRQKEINALVDSIGKQGGFPTSLSIEEKARFCVGYSQQICDYTEKTKQKQLENNNQ